MYIYYIVCFFSGKVCVCVYIHIFLPATVPQHTMDLSLSMDFRNQNRTML